jgi:hypothetical protein
MLLERGALSLIGALFINVRLSLIPFGISVFHYPALGVGISISLWVCIFMVALILRVGQFIKEYLRDPSLPSMWGALCVLIDRGRRGVRAVTLGGRIRVNIIMGRSD